MSLGGLPAKEIEWGISHSSLAVQVGQPHPRPPPNPPTTSLSPSVQGHRSVKRKLKKQNQTKKQSPFKCASKLFIQVLEIFGYLQGLSHVSWAFAARRLNSRSGLFFVNSRRRVLPVSSWVLSRYSGFFSHSPKNTHATRLIGNNAKISAGVSVAACLPLVFPLRYFML